MKTKYKVELEIELDAKNEAGVTGPQDAVLEVMHRNLLLAEAGIEVTSIRVSQGEEKTDESNELESGDLDPALDEYNDSIFYLCRWPNGDFSIVLAPTKRHAIIMLDEWGGAEPDFLSPLDTCMLDFRLSDAGEIELAQIGEETADRIWATCYPQLNALFASDSVAAYFESGYTEEETRAAEELIRKGVDNERKRLQKEQKQTPAETEIGRDLQKQMGTSAVVADHYVNWAAKRILKSKAGQGKKPN